MSFPVAKYHGPVMRRSNLLSLFLLSTFAPGVFVGSAVAQGGSQGGLTATDLRCEHLIDPLGIDDLQPRLSWNLSATRKALRGQAQSAYRVIVASERSLLEQNRGDLWDSERVASDKSHLVTYQGNPLESRTECWWKVRILDEQGNASDWSPAAHWSMGLLTPAAWKNARWVAAEHTEHPGIEITDIKEANWLWYPEGNATIDAPADTRFFRRQITLPGIGALFRPTFFFRGRLRDVLCEQRSDRDRSRTSYL